jgi:succinate dehydrogenase / fumarate reductase flavoprotein subunit
MMQEHVGIVRTEDEMRRALERIAQLGQEAQLVGVTGNREYNPGWHTALDVPNLLTVAEAVTRAAIERRESRGGHFREDYPDKDPAWGKANIVIRKGGDGRMQLAREPIPPMPAELQAIIEEQK